jgi:hypothetical protein
MKKSGGDCALAIVPVSVSASNIVIVFSFTFVPTFLA